eukprot:COSAG02_NODE_1406_length_12786_cov_5.493418_7_plen_47_part_00
MIVTKMLAMAPRCYCPDSCWGALAVVCDTMSARASHQLNEMLREVA